MKEWSDGDIIKRATFNGGEVQSVLVKVHERYATTVNIFDEPQKENNYAVTAIRLKPMYCDIGKLSYIRQRDLDDAELVQTLTDKEYTRLLRKLGEIFGVPTLSVPVTESEAAPGVDFQKECESLQEQIDVLFREKQEADEKASYAANELRETLDKLKQVTEERDQSRAAVQDLNEKNRELNDGGSLNQRIEIARIASERDVYKELYTKLLSAMSGMPTVISTGTAYPGGTMV